MSFCKRSQAAAFANLSTRRTDSWNTFKSRAISGKLSDFERETTSDHCLDCRNDRPARDIGMNAIARARIGLDQAMFIEERDERRHDPVYLAKAIPVAPAS